MKRLRILIIRPDRIGDVVLTTPLIREVKKYFPDSIISVMVGSYTAPLLHGNPHIDSIITDDPQGKDAGRSGFWKKVREIRKHRFDIGLMPLPRERHAWMMLLAGVKKRIGVGGKIYQILTGTTTVSRNKYIPLRHEADYVLDLGRKIGVSPSSLSPELFLTDEERTEARQFFTERGFNLLKPLIGINPGSNKSSPNWIPKRYAELTERLSQQYQIFVNVGPQGSGLEKYFPASAGNILVYAPRDLREIMRLCSSLSVLIAPSTGTMHIAAAMNIPTVSLFCPLTACSPTLWGPLGNRSEIILPVDQYCQFQCPGDPKICPFDGISVERIITAVESLLKNNS